METNRQMSHDLLYFIFFVPFRYNRVTALHSRLITWRLCVENWEMDHGS